MIRKLRTLAAAHVESLAYKLYRFSLYHIRPPDLTLYWTGVMYCNNRNLGDYPGLDFQGKLSYRWWRQAGAVLIAFNLGIFPVRVGAVRLEQLSLSNDNLSFASSPELVGGVFQSERKIGYYESSDYEQKTFIPTKKRADITEGGSNDTKRGAIIVGIIALLVTLKGWVVQSNKGKMAGRDAYKKDTKKGPD